MGIFGVFLRPGLIRHSVSRRYRVRSRFFEIGRAAKTAAIKSLYRQRAWFETQEFQSRRWQNGRKHISVFWSSGARLIRENFGDEILFNKFFQLFIERENFVFLEFW